MDLTDMQARSVMFGPDEIPLLGLVDSWARHVLRLANESKEPESVDTWIAHDYLAALYIRDAVERGLLGETNPAVQVTDALLLTFTQTDEFGLLKLLDDEVPRDPWWWRQVPSAGPIADELQALQGLRGKAAAD
jgi:hypothetical protein